MPISAKASVALNGELPEIEDFFRASRDACPPAILKLMLHNFNLAGESVRLWQRTGESYEHILMKALGYTMFAGQFPTMEIEVKIGLRYKPDLIARNIAGDFLFWGEAGANSIRKTSWILKHTRTKKLVLFKIGRNVATLIEELREEIPAKYRADGRLLLINFVKDIADLTASKQIEKVFPDWFTEYKI